MATTLSTPLNSAQTLDAELRLTHRALTLNVDVVEPALTMTEAGAVSKVFEEPVPTTVSLSAGLESVIVQMAVAYDRIDVGEHARPASETVVSGWLGETATLALFVTPLHVPETVTEVTAVTVPAVAPKLADDAPAGTCTDEGTVKDAEEELSATVTAPAVGLESVAWQTNELPEVTLDGEHVTLDSEATGATVTTADLLNAFRVAVTLTDVAAETVEAVAAKVAEDTPAPIVTLVGTMIAVPEVVNAAVPALGIGPLNDTVHVAVLAEGTVEGEHDTAERVTAVGATVTLAVFVTPFHAADTATEIEAVTFVPVAVNTAELEPAGILIDAGIVRPDGD